MTTKSAVSFLVVATKNNRCEQLRSYRTRAAAKAYAAQAEAVLTDYRVSIVRLDGLTFAATTR